MHHRLKHEAGWRVAHEGGGVLRWHSPVGRHYRTRPATTLWPPAPPLLAADVGDGTAPGTPPPSSGYPDAPPF